MILKFKKSIVIINLFILIIQLLFNSLSIADEKKEQPSVTTKQYRDWTFRCVEIKKKNDCEIVQTLQVNNSNLKFTIAYTNFINEENELKEIINIITPLGVNLQKRVSLNFHKGTKVNLPYIKCEVVGCIISITNNSKDPAVISLFNQIKKAMQTSIYFEIIINGFNQKPILIKSSLQGFKSALKELNNSKS